MKKDIAEKWIAELRSGKWKQTKQVLSSNDKHCCLGVLCEMAARENVCTKVQLTNDSRSVFDSRYEALPTSVQEWAGMKSYNGKYNAAGEYLAGDNDNGKSFSEIADIIEKNIDNL